MAMMEHPSLGGTQIKLTRRDTARNLLKSVRKLISIYLLDVITSVSEVLLRHDLHGAVAGVGGVGPSGRRRHVPHGGDAVT